MLYAAQNGLDFEDYTQFTDAWGAHVHSTECVDGYSNCPDIAKDCCAGRTFNGQTFRELCCASCKVMDEINEACSIETDEELEPEDFADETPVVDLVAEPPHIISNLVRENVECSSIDTQIDASDSLEGCALNCKNTAGCYYFLYAAHNGSCWYEHT